VVVGSIFFLARTYRFFSHQLSIKSATMADENVKEQPQAAEKTQAKKGGKKGKGEKAEVEAVRLGPANVDYSKDNVFGVAHIYASFNDTFVVRIQRCIRFIIDY
jgi:hypothetical protein